MRALVLVAAVMGPAPAFAGQSADSDSLNALIQSVRFFLDGPARKAPRVAAVAAVRGGIPTDQGENLDLRLLDRARALRAALLRPSPSADSARAVESLRGARRVRVRSSPRRQRRVARP